VAWVASPLLLKCTLNSANNSLFSGIWKFRIIKINNALNRPVNNLRGGNFWWSVRTVDDISRYQRSNLRASEQVVSCAIPGSAGGWPGRAVSEIFEVRGPLIIGT